MIWKKSGFFKKNWRAKWLIGKMPKMPKMPKLPKIVESQSSALFIFS
jgi:hypothetical protein